MFSILLALFSIAYATELKVAVIDTGFGYKGKGQDAPLCKTGHADFSGGGRFYKLPNVVDPIPVDNHGHGTVIVGGIHQYAKKAKYCIVVIKYVNWPYDWNSETKSNKAFEYAIKIKADVINYSSSGRYSSSEENRLVKQFLNNGGKLFVAAGNTGDDSVTYPGAIDSRIVVVGGLDSKGEKTEGTNRSKYVNHWESELVEVYGFRLTGTSQATSIATGKFLSGLKKE